MNSTFRLVAIKRAKVTKAAKPDMRAAVCDLGAQLEAQRWNGGVRIVVQGAMRAPIRNGEVTMEASWRADVFYLPQLRRAAFTLVAESPAQLLRDLADFIETPPLARDHLGNV
jgi:hypothetical protein